MSRTFQKLGRLIQDRLEREPDRKNCLDTIVRMVRFATADKNFRTNEETWLDDIDIKTDKSAKVFIERSLSSFTSLRP